MGLRMMNTVGSGSPVITKYLVVSPLNDERWTSGHLTHSSQSHLSKPRCQAFFQSISSDPPQQIQCEHLNTHANGAIGFFYPLHTKFFPETGE